MVHAAIGLRFVLRDGCYRNCDGLGTLLARPSVPLSEWELWACAQQVVSAQGENAAHYVAEQLGAVALAEDLGGIRTWQAIAQRIAELQSDAVPPAPLH